MGIVHHANYVRYLGLARIVWMDEHDMSLVSRAPRRGLALAQGEPLAIGTPREVQSDPRVVEAYLGAAEDMSFLRRKEPFRRTQA